MRTVLFFSLMCIAQSIGSQTGWFVSKEVVPLGEIILAGSVVMDILDFIKNMTRDVS